MTDIATKTPRYTTMNEAAKYAGFSIRTIRRYIVEGRLPGYRVGPKHIRVDLNDVDAMFSTIPPGLSAESTKDLIAAELTGDVNATYEAISEPSKKRIGRILDICKEATK